MVIGENYRDWVEFRDLRKPMPHSRLSAQRDVARMQRTRGVGSDFAGRFRRDIAVIAEAVFLGEWQ
jgi:hypothetical protein